MSAAVDEAMLLDKQLCFLVYRLHRGITDQYRPVLHELGLTYPQYLVMLVLWESEPMTVGQIGSRLHLNTGTLSPLLKRLQSAGLIERNRSPEDERSVLIELTAHGRDMRVQARQATAGKDECLTESAHDARELHSLLSALVARVDNANKP